MCQGALQVSILPSRGWAWWYWWRWHLQDQPPWGYAYGEGGMEGHDTQDNCKLLESYKTTESKQTCHTSNLNLSHSYVNYSFHCSYSMLNDICIGWWWHVEHPSRICQRHHFIAPANQELSSGAFSWSLSIHWLETSFWCRVCSWRQCWKGSISHWGPCKASTYHDTNSAHCSESHCTMPHAESAQPVGE